MPADHTLICPLSSDPYHDFAIFRDLRPNSQGDNLWLKVIAR